ncbi:isopentenyl-diphosphate delta-isomerase [Tropicibacter sp. S64]|uniref:isopentenyl-diphosphate delta-isomerase n=1 Tax=Tropicibacter sp. S64 TaxID=3415122 RepID=UPI003C7B5303
MRTLIPAWINGTLVPVDKLDAHRRGLRHKAVSVFVLREDHVLLQQRALGKYHTPGLWANTCCTHPHWDEPALTCAIRRLREELGITGVTPRFRQQVEYRADVGGGLTEHEVVDLFVAEADAGMRLDPAPAEVMATAWIGLDDLKRRVTEQPERFTPWLRIYMTNHAEGIFGA